MIFQWLWPRDRAAVMNCRSLSRMVSPRSNRHRLIQVVSASAQDIVPIPLPKTMMKATRKRIVGIAMMVL